MRKVRYYQYEAEYTGHKNRYLSNLSVLKSQREPFSPRSVEDAPPTRALCSHDWLVGFIRQWRAPGREIWLVGSDAFVSQGRAKERPHYLPSSTHSFPKAGRISALDPYTFASCIA